MPVATAKEERGDSAIELLVLLKEAPDARSRSATNLVLGVALFRVRQGRGLGRTRRGGWGFGCRAHYRRRGLEARALLRDGLGTIRAEVLMPRACRARGVP
jgi:hypothetical protein